MLGTIYWVWEMFNLVLSSHFFVLLHKINVNGLPTAVCVGFSMHSIKKNTSSFTSFFTLSWFFDKKLLIHHKIKPINELSMHKNIENDTLHVQIGILEGKIWWFLILLLMRILPLKKRKSEFQMWSQLKYKEKFHRNDTGFWKFKASLKRSNGQFFKPCAAGCVWHAQSWLVLLYILM